LKRKGHFCPECALKLEPKGYPAEKEQATDKPAPKPLRDIREAKAKQAGDSGELINDTLADSLIEAAPKQESVSPSSDSYGFKRGSEK